MASTAREKIDLIYKEKTANDALARDLSGALKIISHTVFGQVKHIIHELLQNADDAKAREVSIKICGDYLIFSHTGSHFSDNDVAAISSIGSEDSLKTKNIEKTGFKGVGFKAVFGRADCVYIISDQYSFRFDKDHWKGKVDYPWQVIPVWTDHNEIPTSLMQEYNSECVNIILKLNSASTVQEELLELFKKPLLMLFLRHIEEIEVVNNGKNVHQIKRQKTVEGHCQIIDGARKKYEYLKVSSYREVPEVVRANLRFQPDDVCPPKIKNAEGTRITLAVFITKEKRLDAEHTYPIYCYLPTNLDLGFSFLINGDFLTNAERTDLLSIEWNSFLFAEVAKCFFEWIEKLATDRSYKLDLPALIRVPVNRDPRVYLKGYNQVFSEIIGEQYFLPSENGKQILNLNEGILDQSRISKVIPHKYLLALFPGSKAIIDDGVAGKSVLKTLGCREFNVEQIVELLNQPAFMNEFLANSENCLNLLSFFKEKTQGNIHANLFQNLKVANILLNQAGELKNAKEIYFPHSNGSNSHTWVKLSFLHFQIAKCCCKSELLRLDG